MNEKTTLLGEEVEAISSNSIIRYGFISLIWGFLSSLLGLDAGIMAVTLLTSYVLTGIGFPLGVKYIVVCVSASLLLSILVRGFLGAFAVS